MSNSCFGSDSLNVLWWIRGRSQEFKPFVANRVGEIRLNTSPNQWRYVPLNLNPADILSRGTATELVNCHTWWRGPEYLLQSEDSLPVSRNFDKPQGNDEMKSNARSKQTRFKREGSDVVDESYYAFLTSPKESSFPLDPTRHSSWLRIKRIFSWVNRFVDNCRRRISDRTLGELLGELLSTELKRAEIQLIRHRRPISPSSKIIGLQPKLDDDGIMRSDGRLRHAKFLSFDVRYPIILPRKSWITKLIVKHFHEQGQHASGINQTLAAISARYWVLSGREVIRNWKKQCSECRRRKKGPLRIYGLIDVSGSIPLFSSI